MFFCCVFELTVGFLFLCNTDIQPYSVTRNEKNSSKTITTKDCERMRKKHKEQYIKNKRLSDNIYSIANL